LGTGSLQGKFIRNGDELQINKAWEEWFFAVRQLSLLSVE
jgi:hypothetical protein